jgi:hypothetical protein
MLVWGFELRQAVLFRNTSIQRNTHLRPPLQHQDKVAALIDRAAFVPSPLAGATLEVRDVAARGEWAPLAGSVPLLAALSESGDEVREFPVFPCCCWGRGAEGG